MKAAIKRMTFWIKDILHNRSLIYSQYKEVLKINSMADNDFQSAKLYEIKEFAINNTEFYKDYTVESQFPIMTKIDYIANKERIQSQKYQGKSDNHLSSTSGSTGIPFSVLQNYEKRCRTIADLKAFGVMGGYKSHQKMVCFRAYNGKCLDRKIDRMDNIWRIDVSNLKDAKMKDMVKEIEKQKPVMILSYVSALETFVNYIIKNNIDIKHDKLKSIMTVSEGLSDISKDRISSAFMNIPVYERYSNMEMGIIAQKDKTDFFKINCASYAVEILKLDVDEKADSGTVGRIVVTDLFNKAFPMIRYDTGDLGIMTIINNIPYIEKIYGRRLDVIFNTSGELLNPHAITRVLYGVSGVLQWQFIQKNKCKYELRYVCAGLISVDLDNLRIRIKSQVGNDAVIEFMKIDAIPEGNSYKRKPIINEWKKN
ncbi:MAG: hypothetical protein R3Y54_13275 [Eubacteriales bacterium]